MTEPNDETAQIEVSSEHRPDVVGRSDVFISPDQLRELVDLVSFVLDERGVGEVEVGLHIVSTAAISALNNQYMGVDGPTDVLSFPIDEELELDDPSLRMLGEIVLCPAVAADSQRVSSSGLADELRLLVVHGTLHLLGMDHELDHDRLAMSKAQNDLRDKWANRTGQQRPEPVQLAARGEADVLESSEVQG